MDGTRWRAQLTTEERERGIASVKLAALALYAFPGSPAIYYADEAGMEWLEDPINRGTFLRQEE